MNCSLKCFCDFFEAQTPEGRAAVVKRYKKKTTGPAKGMMVYYKPALRLIKGTLCPDGNLDEKLAALRDACIIPKWTDKLNDARIASNTRVYKSFRSEFGNKKLKVFASPRMQFAASTEISVNLEPEFYAEVDGTVMMWKFGMAKHTQPEHIVRIIIQLLNRASTHKGITVPIEHIRFLDTTTGKTYSEGYVNFSLDEQLKDVANALAKEWVLAA